MNRYFLEVIYPILGTLISAFFVLLFVAYLLIRTFRDRKELQEVFEKTVKQAETERDYWRSYKYAARRKILKRAGNRCEWYDKDGSRCKVTSDLEIDHVYPWSAGGWTIEPNAQVLCQAHHLYKGGSIPSAEEVVKIQGYRERHWPAGLDATVRWRPTEEERALHKGEKPAI